MGPNGQFDDRLARQECRSIRRTLRRVQGINPRIVSAVLLNADELEVKTGDAFVALHWKLRRTDEGWQIVDRLGEEVWAADGGQMHVQQPRQA